jgi:hypothetical protein
LYFRLLHALPEHIVLAQVQLSRILGVKEGRKLSELAQSHQSTQCRLCRLRQGRYRSRRSRARRRFSSE